MASLWEMGEHSGREGTKLDLSAITCPFCLEVGNSADRDLHSARVLPTPRRLDRHPDH